MIKKVFSIVISLLFIFWIYAIISDYIKVKNGERAIYCIRHTIYDYTDGSVEECLALGYKVYYYDRDKINTKTDFGPFWIDMRK